MFPVDSSQRFSSIPVLYGHIKYVLYIKTSSISIAILMVRRLKSFRRCLNISI